MKKNNILNQLNINYFRIMKMIENDLISSHNQGVVGSSPTGPTIKEIVLHSLFCVLIKQFLKSN